MFMNINKSQFFAAFKDYDRQDEFSQAALDALYDYLDETDDYNFDLVGVCSEFSQLSLEEFADYYNTGCERELLAGWYVRDSKDKMEYVGLDEPAFNRMDNEQFLNLDTVIDEPVCCCINDDDELEQLRDEFNCKGTGDYIDLKEAVTDYIDRNGGWYQVLGDSIVYECF